MSLPAEIRECLKNEGPFATAYLDGSRDTEQGEAEVELRWRAAREKLAAAGADEATLAVMAGALDSELSRPGRHGHLLVAAHGRLLLDEVSEEPPPTEIADFSAAPTLMPFLARRSEVVPSIIVLADRTGANIYVNPGDSSTRLPAGQPDEVRNPDQHPIHKTGRNTWSERHFQNRVDNAWSENANDVAHSVREHVAGSGARVVLVAGEVRARSLVLHALAEELPPTVDIAETTAGGRADGASLEAVAEAAHDAVLRIRWRDRREILAKLQQGVARADFAVTGLGPVLQALRSSQVETLVISDDPRSTARAWIGDDPLQLTETEAELADLGIEGRQEVRLDSALIRAVAASDADLLITPNAHSYLVDGLGAVLRYARNPGTVS